MNFHKETRQAVEWFYLLNSATLIKSHDVSYYFTKIKNSSDKYYYAFLEREIGSQSTLKMPNCSSGQISQKFSAPQVPMRSPFTEARTINALTIFCGLAFLPHDNSPVPTSQLG